MRQATWWLVAWMAVSGIAAQAQSSGTGVGVILGEPTGLSLKHWVAADRAVDAAVAWSLSDENAFHLHADYLFHRFDALSQDRSGRAILYYGLGARVHFDEEQGGRHDKEETTAGIRFPVGMDVLLPKTPIGLFLELVPVLEVAPDTDLDWDAALGLRFFFR